MTLFCEPLTPPALDVDFALVSFRGDDNDVAPATSMTRTVAEPAVFACASPETLVAEARAAWHAHVSGRDAASPASCARHRRHACVCAARAFAHAYVLDRRTVSAAYVTSRVTHALARPASPDDIAAIAAPVLASLHADERATRRARALEAAAHALEAATLQR